MSHSGEQAVEPRTLPLGLGHLLDTLACAVVVRDTDGRAVYLNQQARELFGSVEVVDAGLDWLTDDGPQRASRIALGVLRSGKPARKVTAGFVRPDGATVWLQTDVVPVLDRQGKVLAVIGSGVDITELRQAQQQLAQREAYFRALVENLSDVVTVLDAEARILYTSPSVSQLGWTPKQHEGRTSLALVHPDDLEEAQRRFEEALRKPGARVPIAARVRHRDGSWRWAEGVLTNRLDDPNVNGVVANWRDVTARREGQERARVADERWQRLVADSPNAVITVDADGTVLSWNAGAERILGRHGQEALGQSLVWASQRERQELRRSLARVARTGRTELFETHCLTSQGERIPVLATLARLATDDIAGEPEQFILTYADMSVHEHAERQAQTLALLEERERIAMELHDGVIQSLYAVCLGLSAGWRADPADGEALVRRANAQINGVIRDIRKYISDLRPDHLSDHTLEEGLRVLAEELRLSGLAVSDVRLGAEGSNGLRPNVVAELLQIAREATSNVLRHAQAGAVEIALEQVAGQLLLEIRDDGCGFDPDASRASSGDGMANMQARARAIGGAIAVTSAPDQGTRVLVSAPLAPARTAAERAGLVRVLVVDDHELVRLGITQAFHDASGIAIVGEAGSVEQAVSVARDVQPDVVLMDVRLPDGSGVDACRLIRSERPATKVVMLTSYSDDEAALGSVLAGASGYLLKEDDPSQLIASIERVAAGESLLDPLSVQRAMSLIRRPHGGRAAAADPFERLSQQEGRVLRLIAEGKTNREIARVLALSEHTVRTYASNIFSKLHIRRRAEAAALAARQLTERPA